MRDLMFAIVMLMVLPLAIIRPVNAFYLWAWTAALIPTSYFYGFMGGARVNLIFAVLTLTLVALGRVKWNVYQANRVTWLYLMFTIHATFVFILGYSGNPFNAQYYENIVKLMAFCLLMPMFIDSRLRMHVMLLVIVLGLGFHGILDGLKTLASGGAHNMSGPEGSMLSDRNHLSTALAVVLPLIYYLYFYTRNKLVQWGFLLAFGIVTLAILGGGSRGGFLALSIVAFWLVMTTRHRWLTLFLLILIGVLFLVFAPAEWTERLSTIQEATLDESFMGRLIAWKISSALALSNPFFGGGFHAVQVQYVWDMFKESQGFLWMIDTPVPEFAAKAAHSIYFEVMGDMGLFGFAIFVAILLQSLQSRFAIKRMVKQLGSSFVWARDMSDMLMLSIVAFMAGGGGVSLGYFEVIYMVIMLMELLRIHLKNNLNQTGGGDVK